MNFTKFFKDPFFKKRTRLTIWEKTFKNTIVTETELSVYLNKSKFVIVLKNNTVREIKDNIFLTTVFDSLIVVCNSKSSFDIISALLKKKAEMTSISDDLDTVGFYIKTIEGDVFVYLVIDSDADQFEFEIMRKIIIDKEIPTETELVREYKKFLLSDQSVNEKILLNGHEWISQK